MSADPAADAGRRILHPLEPLEWLALAWEDIARAPLASLLHGGLVTAFGLGLFGLAFDRFWVLAGACSGFLLVAPVLATGLYALSRALERGEPADLALVLRVWRSLDRRLVRFGLGLALAGTGWVLTSAALITLLSPQPIVTPVDFLRHVVMARSGWLFELWLVLGGFMAAPVFASSAIAIPLLLDRPVGVWEAVLASWRAVLAHPAALAVWATLVMGLTLLGMAAAMLGLVLVMPLLGHASWHAYRALSEPRPAAAA